MAGFIGISNLIEREGRQITVRPEKISLLSGDEPAPPGAQIETGQVRDVVYAGVLTRYIVDLDAGGELVVARQNAEAPTLSPASGTRVRIAWRTAQAFTIPQGATKIRARGRGRPMMRSGMWGLPRATKGALILAAAALVAAGLRQQR